MAISKLELQKAIENGESVWYLYGEVYELKTSEHTNKFISRSDDYCYSDKKGVDRCAPLDMLYKSKGEAEHYLNHQDITRTEQLPFLTWEEFLEARRFEFIDEFGKIYDCKIYGDKILLEIDGEDWYILKEDLTEENFYKAYDECVKLFKQE